MYTEIALDIFKIRIITEDDYYRAVVRVVYILWMVSMWDAVKYVCGIFV
jgi:hypothetical protein